MTTMYDTPLRVRFAPSPTGHLHVGSARTALFNWLLARKTSGTFILRLEDTDTARNVPGADRKIVEDLTWLGLPWDEGIDVGGPHAPYLQSQRLDLYNQAVRRLLDAGHAYYAFDTADELDAMRKQAEAAKRAFSYPRPDHFPDESDVRKARAEGRPVVVRFRMPGEDITVHDEIMGNVTITAAELDDFIIVKDNGIPTFHLANVCDDCEMEMSLVLRGQEFLAQTPRHIALQRVLGYPTPRYAHMPLTMDMQGRKLSKRDGAVEVNLFRQAGYLPEALTNFIALLGWNPGGDRERMSRDEMIELFSIERMNRVNAKFDRDKLLAFNTDAIAEASPGRLAEAFDDWLRMNPESGLAQGDLDAPTRRRLLEIGRGMRTFADLETKCGFIYRPDDAIEYDPKATQKVLDKNDGEGYRMLERLLPRLETVGTWDAPTLEKLLQDICETESLGMGKVAQPVRVAVSGTTVSPGIGDTLDLLGRDRTLNRIRRCLARRKN
jgi:glutamyl-tRNA synthetase